jgi:hypothetical protein
MGGWFSDTTHYRRPIKHPEIMLAEAELENAKAAKVAGNPKQHAERIAKAEAALAELKADPEKKDGWVELRCLNSGDKAELEDIVQMERGDDEEQTAKIRIGRMKTLTVERAITAWGLPGANVEPTAATIVQLHPETFDQIFALVTFGTRPPDEAPEEEPDPPTPQAASEPSPEPDAESAS